MNQSLISNHRDGFSFGYTPVTRLSDKMGVEFGIRRMQAGETIEEAASMELAYLLMSGEAEIKWSQEQISERAWVKRKSLFDEEPSVLHVSAGTVIAIKAVTECEWSVIRTRNDERFEARIFMPEQVKPEYRGKGLVQDACLRNVRLVFDKEIRPKSKLVVGEVVNYPGRWSSYPPHHHDQPEIYHYRFTLPQGYGHAEIGEDVKKIRNFDTVQIPGGLDHAQVSAPGYGMYYLWIVRHLENNPYLGFEFTEEHQWVLNPENQGWEPPAKG